MCIPVGQSPGPAATAVAHVLLPDVPHLLMLQLHGGSKLPRSANPRSLVQQRYALNAPAALQLAIKRQWILFLRNKAFLIVRTAQVCRFLANV